MAVQHFSRSARTRTFRLSSVFAIIAAAGIAAAGSINVQARDLTAAVNSNFSTLDTWDAIDNLSRAVSSSIYEGLYRFDTNLTPQPQLAESYTVSDDGLVYTFKLRPNVKYQDGSDFTAETVKMNFDRGMNPASKLSRRTFFSFVDKVEAVDPLRSSSPPPASLLVSPTVRPQWSARAFSRRRLPLVTLQQPRK